jgi:hypothetical protein
MKDPLTLIPFPANSKAHTEEQITALAETIKHFKFDQPVVVDQNLVIIKGHGRTLAAIKLGMKFIPVIVSNVSDAEARLNRVLDNHLVSQEYDPHSLREDLLDLKSTGHLSLSLFDEKMIPEVYTAVSRVEATLFSLVTKHKCSQCTYKW